ncbi:MAG: TRAP transporter large permease subunit, partial [Planctomycetes bacterium]|nr:TRAP transporter large permease subunit [Planctomycetota bacterium]
ATPPCGITLCVTRPIAKVKIEETVRESIPFLAVTIGILLLITFVPEVCLFLPRTFGYL